MFDLDKEIANWSAAVHAGRCRSEASVAELRDHLYCEIERARAEGLTEEQAFSAAVAKLGSAPELAAENAKNRSLLAAVCAAERPRGPQGKFLMAHGIVWAAVMIGSALLSIAGPMGYVFLLTLVLVPSWFASEQILRRALRGGPAGA
ncbi:MAG TPA: permease prefix domain 1-containing protein [Methyloceanibacter sp.]|nr:permease prefix domain 1-containing protein [Methyloceanibacter sp.]